MLLSLLSLTRVPLAWSLQREPLCRLRGTLLPHLGVAPGKLGAQRVAGLSYIFFPSFPFWPIPETAKQL